MTTALITHQDCLNHVNPPGHPEQVARLMVIERALKGFDLLRIDAPLGKESHILRCHPQSYIDALKSANIGPLDPDTHMSAGTYNAALRGVGGIIQAVDMVMAGDTKNAFVACRPPGHHAETGTAMGFCLFGNVAIAAKHALEQHNLSRVAIMDFDVHHGNGTQDLVWNESRIFFASTQQMPLFPGSGAADETGAHGQIMNVPLPEGSDGSLFREKMTSQILPAIDAWQPEMMFISAGFDAHRNDPLAGLNWDTGDFVWATQQLCDLAEKHCHGRLVSTLEGGYDLDALAASVAAHVKVLQEQ
ncbi:MAG: histone deacetylase family protein [Rhodobacteraceae bacterium]|nr:histone deacetylase family protein [Paracoccaceae bacterium]